MFSCNRFASFDHAAIKWNHKVNLCTVVVRPNITIRLSRNSIVAHVKRAKRHRRSITRTVGSKVLSWWCSIVLELHSLISNISRCGCYRVRSILYLWIFIWVSRTYCEKTDKEVVVETCLMVSVTRLSWILPAARLIISSWNWSPGVLSVNLAPVAVMSSPLAEILVPDHDECAPPWVLVATVRLISMVEVVVDCIDPWVNCGVTVWAETGAANSNNINSFFIPFFLV